MQTVVKRYPNGTCDRVLAPPREDQQASKQASWRTDRRTDGRAANMHSHPTQQQAIARNKQ